ncbi:MAG: hypothetical protein K0Q49_38 [Haloplasmataceae bacterium]|jgi:uncharacterized lipoprotein YddW (UPF0748 family)|nr:hypothetical protein [Haloplasmataceae bacterium]
MSEEIFKITFNVDGINSVRGTNQIIIFTYDHRTENNGTGTNEYGYELAIDENNRVYDKGTHVKFRERGIIISAHGTNGALFADKVQIGDCLFYAKETNHLVFTREIKDILLRIKTELNTIRTKLTVLEKGLFDVDIEGLKADFNAIEIKYDEIGHLNAQNNELVQDLVKTFENQIFEFNLKLVPAIVVEERGFWHRPNIMDTEYTLEGIVAFLSEMKAVGFNSIYIETFWWGRSISNSIIVGYHPRVKDGDYGNYLDFLSAFIDIAHELDIEVHAWTETFFIGGDTEDEVPHWIKGKEHWLNTTYKGGNVQTGKGTEEGFIFLDPSNEEVKDYLIEYYKELASYPLDGIQFDYIRYPHEDNLETSSGYTVNAMNLFKYEKGLKSTDDLRVLLSQDENLFAEWKIFRQNHVSDFVQKAVKAIKKVNPAIKISIAVGSDPDGARNVLLQDWPTWVNKGLIDIIAPMAYSRDIDYIKAIVKKMNKISDGKTYNYTGIGTFMEFPEFENVQQILASRDEMGLGSILFASQYIYKHVKMQNVLTKGIFSKPAITPNASIEKLLNVTFKNILDKVKRIYLVKNLIPLNIINLLEAEFNRIQKINELKSIINKLNQLILDFPNDLNNVVADRIIDDLKYLLTVLKIRLNNEEKKI